MLKIKGDIWEVFQGRPETTEEMGPRFMGKSDPKKGRGRTGGERSGNSQQSFRRKIIVEMATWRKRCMEENMGM